MSLLFNAVFCLSLIAQDESKDWGEVIRDMLTTNAARTAEGHVDYDIEIQPRKSLGDHPARLQAQVDWDGPKFLMKYRYYCEYEGVLDEIRTIPIDLAKWGIRSRDGSEDLFYDAETQDFHVHNLMRSWTPLLHLSPPELWARCCPPWLSPGRPWVEMVDLVIIGDQEKSKMTTTVLEGDLVRRDRLDPNGHRVSITYSLKQGGNPVEMSGVGKDGFTDKYLSKYTWSPLGDAWVLNSAEIDTHVPCFPKESMQIRIKASNCSLVVKDKAMFRREKVMALHPEATLLLDHKTNKQIRLDRPPAVAGARLRELAEKMKSRGFAKKP